MSKLNAICLICEVEAAVEGCLDLCEDCHDYYYQPDEEDEHNGLCEHCHKELKTPKEKRYGVHLKCEDAAIAAYEAIYDCCE